MQDTWGDDSATFSPNGKQILTGSKDKTAKLWDITTQKCVATFSGHVGEITSVAFSPDGATILTGSTDKSVMLWDIINQKIIFTFKNLQNFSVTSVKFSPDGLKGADWVVQTLHKA